MVLDVKTCISLGISAIGYIVAVVQFIVKLCKTAKEKKLTDLKALLKENLIPLMEQAERALDNGAERETWVINKLGSLLHIDFYKYKNTLAIAKEIITEICEETKINVNKVITIESKQTKTEEKEDGTNGVF